VNLVLGKWAQGFSPRDLLSVVADDVIGLGLFAYLFCGITSRVGLIGQRHTLTERVNRQQSKRICLAGTGHAYAPRAYGQLGVC
jgi:hypothetical protein